MANPLGKGPVPQYNNPANANRGTKPALIYDLTISKIPTFFNKASETEESLIKFLYFKSTAKNTFLTKALFILSFAPYVVQNTSNKFESNCKVLLTGCLNDYEFFVEEFSKNTQLNVIEGNIDVFVAPPNINGAAKPPPINLSSGLYIILLFIIIRLLSNILYIIIF